MSEGNLLGHIISKSGIKVDPNRVRTITQIPFPVNKKAMQSFLGKINFVPKFISDYARILKPIQEMVKKDAFYKCDKRENDVFPYIKHTIAEAPAFYSPDFNKYFLLYTFSSDTSLFIMLTQKDELNNERPISFMTVSMQGLEPNHPSVDKQSYAVYKAVKHFRPYLLKNNCIIFLPHPAVRSLLVQ